MIYVAVAVMFITGIAAGTILVLHGHWIVGAGVLFATCGLQMKSS